MPDIGTTLREARMRARIDISEIEAETKIRAKYLRALENEEWDLLPGPTYVKSFLRTYADALGLDGKLLIEEYKLRHERLSDVELQPIAPPGQRERRRRPRAAVSRGWLVGVVVLALLAGLWVIGNRNQGDGGGPSSTPPAASTPPTTTSSGSKASSSKKKATTKRKAKAKPKLARLQIVATGQVYVCLKAAGKRTPVPGIVLTGGARQGPYKSSRFRLQLGTSEARLIVNGKSRAVPPVANGIGYEITPRKVRRLPASQWPRCPTA
jgi:cytoskeletal protein RodZ